MKRLLSILLVFVFCLMLFPASVGAVTRIEQLNITMDHPDPGTSPIMTATCGKGYSIYDIEWYDTTADRFLENGEKITAGHSYYAYLWVEADDGYVFASADDRTPLVTAKVNGETCSVQKAFEYIAPAMVRVRYATYQVPSIGWIRSVDVTVREPAVGETPSYYGVNTATYVTGNITFGEKEVPERKNGTIWYELSSGDYIPTDSKFQSGKQYGVYMTLLPKAGYKFVPQPTATVNGKPATASTEYDAFVVLNATFAKLSHTHTPSQWYFATDTHYKTCSTCGEPLAAEVHYGGTATCIERAKCLGCGYPYGTTASDHKWSPTYLYQDKTGHAWVCADCNKHSDIQPHTAAPVKNPDDAVVCKDCGYILTPAKGHQHDLSHVPATPADCMNGGNIEYYFCTGCNDCFKDAAAKDKIPESMSVLTGALGHRVSDEWYYSEQFHWRVCTVCRVELDETKMLHEFDGETCTTCGYTVGDAVSRIVPPGVKKEPQAPKAPQTPLFTFDWKAIVLVAAVCFAAAITATVIILKRKKK